MTLRLMKEQGVLNGDLTPLQRYALHLASTFDRADKQQSDFQLTKSLQMFVNPQMFQAAYGAEKYEEEQEGEMTEDDYQIDLSSPEELDSYLERLYEQKEHTKSTFVGSGQTMEVNIG